MRVPAILSCILVVLVLCGCLPQYASIVVRDVPEPNTRFIWHDGDLYTRNEAYSLQSLAERLASPDISHVKVYFGDDRSAEGKAAALHGTDSSQPTLRLDESTAIPLHEVNRIEFFREIPKSRRHQGFLVSVISVTLLTVASGDRNKIAIGAGAGAALGTIFLLRQEEISERVLFSYDTSR